MLQGLRVVELATMVAAPAAAGLLADWGAEVVKIEPHAGDPMRGRPGSPLGGINYDLHNRGKRSLALNTSAPETRDIIIKLVERADIFLTNMLPDQLTKLRLDYPTLHAVNPRMVYGAVSSFGRTGPDADRGATDNLGFWARGGGTGLLTVEGQDPLPIRQSVGDRLTGAIALGGILAAVTAAQRDGVGRFVDTSLLSSGIWAFATDVANQANKGRTASSKDRFGAVMPLSNYFRTSDGRWLQVMADVPRMAQALDAPELAADPRFAGPRPAREHHAALVQRVDELFGRFTYAEVKPRLEAAGVRNEPVQTPADIVADPQVQATGRLVQVDGEDGERHWQVANPWSVFDEAGREVKADLGAVPVLGGHTAEILAELGYGDADLARLRENGTILPN